MALFKEEIKDMKTLKEFVKNKEEILDDYEVAVIVYAFDKDNKIIFQRRGPGCRDEVLKLETIGGRVKESDIDFKSALNREIVEEVGTDAKIEIEEFITATYAKTFDVRYNKGSLKSGELKIKEPNKCLGYERYKIGEVNLEDLSKGAIELYKIVSEKYSYLK